MIDYTPNEIMAIWSAGCGSPGCIFSRLDRFHAETGDSLKQVKDFDFERDFKSAKEKLDKYNEENK